MSFPHFSTIDELPEEFDNKADYEDALKSLQEQFLHVQQALFHCRQRSVIVFEGIDASGKGGAIRRATQMLDPRGFRVHAIGAPSPEEQGRHYLWRFFSHLPKPGLIAIFDRSWYGRVLVERVEGLAKENEWRRAYREINELERWLVDDGIRVVKIFLSITQEEQALRFEERLSNPRKYWKLTEEDLRNRRKWDDYINAGNEMFAHTHTDHSPWHLIDAQHKWRTRIQVMRLLIEKLSKGIDIDPPAIDEELLESARDILGLKIKHALPTN